jgi:beta-galactosidase
MKKMKLFGMLVLFCMMSTYTFGQQKQSEIRPSEIWKDVKGDTINAHGGGLLYYQGTYYWYGEIKKGTTWLVPGQNWECYRVNAGGVSCYSSKDLVNWKNEGVVLPANMTDPNHDLHFSKVLERPKVIYNEKTKKFVLWLHIDAQDYSAARVGVAVSDKPVGPFKYIESCKPNGLDSRDMTIFKDDDKNAYLIYSSEWNKNLHISKLSDDYLKMSGQDIIALPGMNREAPALFKYNKKYYLITSLTTGWDPNKALVATADSIMGKWKQGYNPCHGEKADITFTGQSTYVLPIEGKPGKFIFMADIWKKTNLQDSRYIWLPLEFKKDSVSIEWKKSWNPAK